MIRSMLAAAAVAAALIVSPPASADTTDDAFIATLDAEGITYPSSAYAIRAAGIVCDALDDGYTVAQVVTVLHKESALTRQQAAYFTGASVAAYCDWHADLFGVTA